MMIKKVFPILAISVFSSMLGVGIIAPLLPLYAESLGATAIWIGVIFASFSISRAIFMPVFGQLSDRRGRKRFICAGLFIYALISLGYVWASTASELTVVRLVQGGAAGMIVPIAQAYVGDLSPKGEEGKWMGYFTAAFFTGFGFGPLLGGVLTDCFQSMAPAFYAMGILNLLAFLLALTLLPEVYKKEQPTANPQVSFRRMISESKVMKGVFSFRLAYSLGRGSFSCFLPIFAAFSLGLSPGLIGVLLAVNTLTISIPQIFSGKIADRFNRRGLVIAGCAVNLLFLALIPWAQNLWQLLVLCLFVGLGAALAMPAASAMTVEEGRTYGMGSAMGVFTMAMSIGMAVGPLLSGVIADTVDVNSVFYLGAVMVLLGTGLFIWFTR